MKQKGYHDNSNPLRIFVPGDGVFVKNFSSSVPKWLSGKIIKLIGSLSYCIKLANGVVTRRHIDHIHKRDSSLSLPVNQEENIEQECYDFIPTSIVKPNTAPLESTPRTEEHSNEDHPQETTLHRSNRIHKPPDRLNT